MTTTPRSSLPHGPSAPLGRRTIAWIALVGLTVLTASACHRKPKGERDIPPPLGEATDLGSGLSMLSAGFGGNVILLVGSDGALIVDDQLAETAEANLTRIRQLAHAAPKYVLNTHWHADHVGGNAVFQANGAIAVGQRNIVGRISGKVKSRFFGQRWPALPREMQPALTFDASYTLPFDGQTVRMIHVPRAHTDGDAFVYFPEADVLHTGDVFVNHMYPLIDRGSGGTLKGLLDAYRTALSLAGPNTKIVPGHGQLATRDDLEETLGMVEDIAMRVKERVERKQTLKQVLAEQLMSSWRGKFTTRNLDEDRFVTTIYEEVVSEKRHR